MVVLGFDAVRNIAITVLLFEHLQNKSNASQLQEEFLRACLAGLFARELARRLRLRDGEQSYICARCSTIWAGCCASSISRRRARHPPRGAAARLQRERGAARARRFYEELGWLCARLGLPELIQNSMRTRPRARSMRRAVPTSACRAWPPAPTPVAMRCRASPLAERERALADIAARFDEAVPVPAREARERLRSAVDEIGEFARVVKVSLAQTRFGRNLRHFIDGSTPAAAPVDAT